MFEKVFLLARQYFSAGILRSLVILICGSLLSRIFGFFRDMAMAWLLGGSATADLLATALRLPFMIRRLLGEGTLSLVLTTACARIGGNQGLVLAHLVSRRIACYAAVIVLLLLICAPWLMRLLASELTALPENLALGTDLFRLAICYVFFALLASGGMAALHSHERFLLPALSPTAFNVIFLLFAALAYCMAGSDQRQIAIWLASAMLVGGVCQWLMNIPYALQEKKPKNAKSSEESSKKEFFCYKKNGGSERLRDDSAISPEKIRQTCRLIPAGIFGAALPQMAFLLASIVASFQAEGHLTALFYAERLLEFPLGLFGAAVGMATAPRLARLAHLKQKFSQQKDDSLTKAKSIAEADCGEKSSDAASSNQLTLQETTRRSVILALVLNLPAAVGLMILAEPIITLLFVRGAFDTKIAHLTSQALCAYAPGLPAYAISRPLLATCHAREDHKTPIIAALFGLGLTLCSSLLLVQCGEPVPAPPTGVAIGLWGYCIILWRKVFF